MPISEIELTELLRKYAGGRIPPLISTGPDRRGLMDAEFLGMYQRGFTAANVVALGTYLPADYPPGDPRRWREGSYAEARSARAGWVRFCERYRGIEVDGRCPGEKTCRLNDADRAAQAEREGRVLAYMCHAGLIEFVTPVVVGDEVIAVICTGQRKPKKGAIWPASAIEEDGLIDQPRDGEDLVDAWAESVERIAKLEDGLHLRPGELLAEVTEEEAGSLSLEVGPEEVESLREKLQEAGQHLSFYANQTYELEKGAAVGGIRAGIAASLLAAAVEGDQDAQFLAAMKQVLLEVHQLTGCDLLAYVRCGDPKSPDRGGNESRRDTLFLVAQAGFADAELPVRRYHCPGREAIVADVFELAAGDCVADIELGGLRNLPVFREFAERSCARTVLVPARIPGLSTGFWLAGWDGPAAEFGDNRVRRDGEILLEFAGDMALVVEVFYMLGQLRETTRAQADFIEAISHDLRSPMQNILVAAENIQEGRVPPGSVPGHLGAIVKQLIRLDWITRRVWALERIRSGQLEYDDSHRVDVMAVLRECKLLLDDLAAQDSVEIVLDPSLGSCPPLRVDREMFQLSAINLLHNALKYSCRRTQINVCVEVRPGEVTLTFANRGIGIDQDDLSRVWDKGFRTKAAMSRDPSGMGLGLALVRNFLENYGGRGEVRCDPIPGAQDHLVRFLVTIPR